MYLNVSLTPPTSGTNTCPIPKTPEILNSIINLTSSVRSVQYECEGPISEVNSSDEVTSFEEYSSYACRGSPLFHDKANLNASSPVYDTPVKQLDFGFGMGNSSMGTPSPPVPELPSPVQPVEATKTALIKEGLKYQIQTKLQAAGLSSPNDYGEQKAFAEELTLEDEERRRRRRERNKVAATKCRNKKKERTSILVNESEEVEDENLKLKTEIQRLKIEKMELEKLLEDPHHTSCCLRNNVVSSHIRNEAVSLANTTSIPNVTSSGGHYTIPNNKVSSQRESTGMSYSTLSIPSPISTTSYIYNNTEKQYFESPENKPFSKFSSYPLTCADALKCVSELEGSEKSFTTLSSFSTENLNREINIKDKSELTSNLAVQYSQNVHDSNISVMGGNCDNSFITRSILESGRLNDSICYKKPLGQKPSLLNSENDFICNSGVDDLFGVNEPDNCEAIDKYILSKTKCLSRLPKSTSTPRYCPYDRSDIVETPLPEYGDRSLENNNFGANVCSPNITGTFSAEYNRQFYPTCTFESI